MEFACTQCGQTLPLCRNSNLREYQTWYCTWCGKGHEALFDVDADERLWNNITLRPLEEVAVE
jgi:hypothetical protein